jgi:CheY-like chemotaxis protein
MTGDASDRPVVLVVDDDKEVIETYELWLTSEYELRTATDGEAALGQLDDAVDVVLLDRLMPGVSGEEILGAIRERDVDCQVAMATAVEPDEDIAEMPFDAYVTKALERDSVRETIQRLLDRSEFDDTTREHYAIAEKLVALEESKTETELAESEEYHRLRERFEELDERLSTSPLSGDDLVYSIEDSGSEPTVSAVAEGDAVAPDAYDLLHATAGSESRPVPPGTSLLVAAPMPAGQEFIVRSLARTVEEGAAALAITTDESAETAVADTSDGGDRLCVVACAAEFGLDGDHPAVVQDVDTPRNLTDIGIGFTNAVSEFEELGLERGRCGLLSLSVSLSYVDRETAYRFCQTLSRGLAGEELLGLFLLDRNAHDQQTQNTLRRAFDGLVEIRARGDGHELRVTGLDGVTADWAPIA